MLRILVTIPAAALLLLAAACDDTDRTGDTGGDNVNVGQQIPPNQTYTEPRRHRVTIERDGVTPDQLAVAAGVNQQLQVTNAGDTACRFAAPPYILAVEVPPGQTVTVNLTTPDVARNTGLQGANVVDMGCEGDKDRQGSLVVEARGPSTDPGAVTPNPSGSGVQPGPGVAGTQMAGATPSATPTP